jgi:general secretion pathway protein D
LLKTIARVRDAHIDERLNLIVIRESPEVVALAEKLILAVDLPEPEVMLEVEVMELSTDRMEELGLQWPDKISYGLLGTSDSSTSTASATQVPLGQYKNFRASIANPAVVATLHGTSSDVNLLANPKIRVRNRDKAKVQIGERVPQFTTTSNFSVNTSVAASVSYMDVGLKLEVEPTVQLDNDVIIKMNLEVSNLISQVTGPGGTTAYEIGTRQTSTTLRLADGETQVLAGLINDEDRKSAAGIPGISRMPLLGALFGTQTGTRSKNEVVLLITPHVVRNLALPDSANTRLASGTDAMPGAFSTRIRTKSATAAEPATDGTTKASPAPLPVNPSASEQPTIPPAEEAAPAETVLRLEVTPQVPAGGNAAATLRNSGSTPITGVLTFDASKLAPVQTVAGAAPGRLPVSIAPKGSAVIVLRTLPNAAGNVTKISFAPSAGSTPVRQEGSGAVTITSAR